MLTPLQGCVHLLHLHVDFLVPYELTNVAVWLADLGSTTARGQDFLSKEQAKTCSSQLLHATGLRFGLLRYFRSPSKVCDVRQLILSHFILH